MSDKTRTINRQAWMPICIIGKDNPKNTEELTNLLSKAGIKKIEVDKEYRLALATIPRKDKQSLKVAIEKAQPLNRSEYKQLMRELREKFN